jgi:hypothetical protein
MKLYKLTTQGGYTRKGESNETEWKKGFTLTKESCDNPRLCSSDVIHAYTNCNFAFLMNPIHANLSNPQLWEAEGEVVVKDWDKVGVFSLTLVNKMDNPAWVKKCPQDVQIRFAILCAELVFKYFENKYPTGDRRRQAIEEAKEYLKTKTSSAASAVYDAAFAAFTAFTAFRATGEMDFAALADKAVELVMKGED